MGVGVVAMLLRIPYHLVAQLSPGLLSFIFRTPLGNSRKTFPLSFGLRMQLQLHFLSIRA